MSGVQSTPLSAAQIQQILQSLVSRITIGLNSPVKLLPGQPLLASLTPLSSLIDASELLNGIIIFAWLEKDVLYKDVSALAVPTTDQVANSVGLAGDTLLKNLESDPTAVIKQPFPPSSLSGILPQAAGLLAQLAGTLSLPKLSVSVKVQWILTNADGQTLVDGTDMISTGLTNPTVSILIPPIFRELRKDTIANPGGDIVCLTAKVSLSVGDEPPLAVTLGPIPVLQLPILVPTIAALFSEPNFGLTQDSAVLLAVPSHSPFASAAPVFAELQKIEGVLDSLRSIASIAGFLLGLNDVIALTEQPRLRFYAGDEIPKFGEIVIKRKPWYDVFGDDQTFDDTVNSLFVFGIPGTRVTFYNDTAYKTTTTNPSSKQGFYEIKLNDQLTLSTTPDPNSPLPDFLVGIPSFPTEAMVQLHPELSNRNAPPPTVPANRIASWEPDQTGDHQWDTDLSSMRFSPLWLETVAGEVKAPTIITELTCGRRKPVPTGTAGKR